MNRSFGYYYAVTKNEMEKVLCFVVLFLLTSVCMHMNYLPVTDICIKLAADITNRRKDFWYLKCHNFCKYKLLRCNGTK